MMKFMILTSEQHRNNVQGRVVLNDCKWLLEEKQFILYALFITYAERVGVCVEKIPCNHAVKDYIIP